MKWVKWLELRSMIDLSGRVDLAVDLPPRGPTFTRWNKADAKKMCTWMKTHDKKALVWTSDGGARLLIYVRPVTGVRL